MWFCIQKSLSNKTTKFVNLVNLAYFLQIKKFHLPNLGKYLGKFDNYCTSSHPLIMLEYCKSAIAINQIINQMQFDLHTFVALSAVDFLI